MRTSELITVAVSGASVVLAIFTICLTLHFKQQADENFVEVSVLLAETKTLAESMYEQTLDLLRDVVMKNRRESETDNMVHPNIVQRPSQEEEQSDALEPNDEDATARPIDHADKTVSEFLEVTGRMSRGRAFTNADRDLAMHLAATLAQREVRTMPRVMIALGELLSSFAAANLGIYIDLLDDMFSSEILAEPILNAVVLEDLGRRILASDEPSGAIVDRFVEHRRAGLNLGNFVHALAPWAVYNFKQGQERTLTETLERIEGLDLQYRDAIRAHMDRMSDASNWMHEPTLQGRQIAGSYKQFLADYGDRL